MRERSRKRSVLALVAVTLVAVAGMSLYGQSQTQNQATGPARSRAEETLEWWNRIGNKLIAMAKDFPEDKPSNHIGIWLMDSPCSTAFPHEPLVSSVERGIRAAHRRGECDRQDLGVPYSGPRSVRPTRMPSESHQGCALVPGETDVSLCQQCPN
jgi:hypothetical protein